MPPVAEEITALQRLLAAHDPAALEELYAYARLLEIVLARKFGHRIDDEDRKDIVADALLHAWQTGDRFDPRLSSIKSWLVMVAVYQAREFLRRNGESHYLRLDLIDTDVLTLEDAPQAEAVRPGVTIKRMLEQLPTRRARVIEMYYYEGQPVPEIAQLLQISEAAVASHLSQGRASLRRVLASERVAA